MSVQGTSSAQNAATGSVPATVPGTTTSTDPSSQMNAFRSYVSMLTDPQYKDDSKLKAAQAVSDELEGITLSPHYKEFLEHAVPTFLKVLTEGDPIFIAELHMQQLRKLLLEMIHRLPSNDSLRPFLRQILPMCFKLLQKDNEENVMVAVRIIIELYKTFRPQFNPECALQIKDFLSSVKAMYSDLPGHLPKIFESKSIRVSDLSELNLDRQLKETFSITPIQTEKKQNDGNPITYNLIPRAVLSLKVLTELPIIVVLMLQLYKDHVYQEVVVFIPLIMNTITIQPPKRENINKEVFVDLIAAQIKILSFLAYIIKTFQDRVAQHSDKLVQGMLQLLELCPSEVAHLRKELLIATKHILALEFRVKFVPHIDRLFDENLLFGSGWTAHDTLRPLAYSTLADLVHHVRAKLNLQALSKAIHLFSKNIHDETLPTSIQTMSCKLLLNLVECIRNYNHEDPEDPQMARDLLIRMLQVFVDKFKSISKLQVPYLKQRHAEKDEGSSNNSQTTADSNNQTEIKQEESRDTKPNVSSGSASQETENKDTMQKIGSPPNVTQNYSVTDCKALVKTLVSSVKTITWGCSNLKMTDPQPVAPEKVFHPKEVLIFIRFVKWAMQALDVYTINASANNQQHGTGRAGSTQPVGRTKEEKEVLEHFAGVFTLLSPSTFKEIFSTSIDYVVDRIHMNPALQGVANTFLANEQTSPVFATILVEYLLKHMEEMGAPVERSGLYLKLFKLVFGSVSLFAAPNEQMLKPHLHQIVNKSMELAMSAKESYNYFLLLRALFRSIGGGKHDLLYQEFLPLLPTLLQGLNSLQSGLHKQHMKDLFVELCLTVPVRLSSLLPYLPMLMDPLVSALNGSQTLISQGLRTLELCVDNLQPDFLYEHIQPVRAELMQALWKTLRNPNESTALGAFRVLGKFGGGNRKMMIEPQKLQYEEQEAANVCINVQYPEHRSHVVLPVEKIIDVAFNALKTSTTEPWYRQQCWEVVRCFIVGSMMKEPDKASWQKLLGHPNFKEAEITSGETYRCRDDAARRVQKMALTAMLVAAAIKELSKTVLQVMVAVVRHYTLVTVSQQAGPFNVRNKIQGMDAAVLVDALTDVMGHEEKELCKPGHLALILIIDTASNLLGSKERASRLPIMEYIVEKMCQLCYQRAWYTKFGGCLAIKVLFENMCLKWVLQHQYSFLRALLYVMMDLTNEVSTGAVDNAKANLEKMLQLCASPLQPPDDTDEMKTIQEKSLHEVTQELVMQITSANVIVREQTMSALRTLGKLTGRGVTEVMLPHKDIFADTLPPKKYLLRHQPANVQIGLMEGSTFCTTLEPRLFTLNIEIQEHKVFVNELLNLIECDDASLRKYSCYKNVTNLVPLRKSALRALSACNYIANIQDKLFLSLYKALKSSTNPEIQETAYEGIKKVMASPTLSQDAVNNASRNIHNYFFSTKLTLQWVTKLSYFTQLFPSIFQEKICQHLLQQATPRTSDDLKLSAAIFGLFHRLPAASAKFLNDIIRSVLNTEQALMIEAGSPLKEPLVKYLVHFPNETLKLFLSENYRSNEHYGRCLEVIVRNPLADSIRSELEKFGDHLFNILRESSVDLSQPNNAQQQYLSIRLILLIARNNNAWLETQPELMQLIRELWASDEFHERHHGCTSVSYAHWKVPRMIISILLIYYKRHNDDVHLLFHLMRAFIGRYIPEFQFLREFLEETVSKTYSVEWKRKAFFEFVKLFTSSSPKVKKELKATILQYIIIPCFAVSLEKGETDILSDPLKSVSTDDVVTVFIKCIISGVDTSSSFPDALRILLLQLSCLLVDKASSCFHDEANDKQGLKLRQLMTFAWPCLLTKNCVDPATKYHGHLLLSHIISKFAINRRIVLQVFHSLLKAHAMEARTVVRQALEILTPAMPIRMEDGNTMLTHWTRKILVEEGHSIGQLVHILQLVVRHADVYQPVRTHLMHHITNAMHKLGFSLTANMDQKKLAVDLAEVCIKWEEKRMADELAGIVQTVETKVKGRTLIEHYRPAMHADTVVYFLVRFPCQVHEPSPPASTQASQAAIGEVLFKRCYALLKRALVVWPNPDPKLVWLDKLLTGVESNTIANIGNACAGIELLTFLIGKLETKQMLPHVKSLTRGLLCCCASTNAKVIKLFHQLLLTIFSTIGVDDLDEFVSRAVRLVQDTLPNLYGAGEGPGHLLYPFLMVLRAVSQFNVIHLDRTMAPLMKVLQRVTKEHISPTPHQPPPPPPPAAGRPEPQALPTPITNIVDTLILILEIVKNRVGVMVVDMRRAFIGNILVGLIEKTPDAKVMKAIVKIVGEWVKTKPVASANQAPSLREKSILLVKLMQYVEKRFADDSELMSLFLNLINFVYRDESLRNSELVSKLETAFLAGLRCTQPTIRNSFFEVFHESVPNKLHARLLYIVCSQNWDNIGQHYWIKQCIQLLLITAQDKTPIQCSNSDTMLPSVTHVLTWADHADRTHFSMLATVKEEETEAPSSNSGSDGQQVDIDIELSSSGVMPTDSNSTNKQTKLGNIIAAQWKFYQDIQNVYTSNFLAATAQLCHMDTSLAEWMWRQLFPKIWKILSERQQQTLAKEIPSFLSSGAHIIQKECYPSSIQTFVEALCLCQPSINIKPSLLKYLGKMHNLWHRMTLQLESTVMTPLSRQHIEITDPILTPHQEALFGLNELYTIMKEDDLWAGLWQTHAHYHETKLGVTYEQHGFMEQAVASYEVAMNKAGAEMAHRPHAYRDNAETKLWENHWIRCQKELNNWEMIKEFGEDNQNGNPYLVLESAWRIPEWNVVKEALHNVDKASCPREYQWKVNMFRGYLTVCNEGQPTLSLVEKVVECASALCIREWKKLPSVVSHIHLPILQAAQQVMELQEACQIHQGLLAGSSGSLHDMKAIVKTWRNRLPVIADDLSHWSDIFTWRHHQYQFIVDHYTEHADGSQQTNSMLGVHASAQAIIHFGKIARKHNLTTVCLESLSRIHNIPSVPIVDCFQKIRQQVKCYLHMAISNNLGRSELQEGLEVIESTNLKFFMKDMTAEFYALKGLFLSYLGRAEEANKALSASVQFHDTLVKGWALWGEFLEAAFSREPSNITIASNAITCFLHAARSDIENKARKYLAKVFWLLSFEGEGTGTALSDAVDKFAPGVPAIQWLAWIPQILTYLVRSEGKVMLNLLNQVGKLFPQAVYLPVRTLYLTLRIEQRGRHKRDPASNSSQQPQTANDPIRATEAMLRCSKILQIQRDFHPTVLVSLEGIVDQMMWFRENWYEEVLRQLRQALSKCYTVAFENSSAVSESTATPHTQSFVKKLVATFGLGVENLSSSTVSSGGVSASGSSTPHYTSTGSESLARRAQATVQDPVFHKLKGQFTADFDFEQPGSVKLHNLIHKLKKWIKILEARLTLLPKWFLIEDKCRFLTNFSLQTAEIELPGEFLLPKNSLYYIRIARFLPKVDIVHKYGSAPRRLHIRGHNGRVYPYLVVSDSSLSDSRREERVQQLLRMLNVFFTKQKETSRRFIHIYVSKVVAFSPQNRIVEDNLSSLSLMDIYRHRCQALTKEPDTPITRYYEKLAAVQARGSTGTHQVLKEIVKEVQNMMVPNTILKDWAIQAFPNATHYWTFRKMVTVQLGVLGLMEYVLHLTRLYPDMLYFHQDTGLINVAYFKFNIDDAKGELDGNRPVLFRLTPNLAELCTPIGVTGPLTASMMVSARCLGNPSYKVQSILRAILRDEIIAWHKRQEGVTDRPNSAIEVDALVTRVNKAVSSIMARIQALAQLDQTESKATQMVRAVLCVDNLCRMDPAWHPWL